MALEKQKVLLVSPACPSCDAVKKYLKKEGIINDYVVLDVSTKEGLDFARRLGVTGVPECAMIEGEGDNKTVRVCSEEEWRKMLKGR